MEDYWIDIKLGEVVNLKRGYDLPKRKRIFGKVPIISSSGITDFHNDAKIEGPGVVTGRYGTIGQVFYYPDSFFPLNTTLYVQDFKGNYPRFIFYLLKTINYWKYSDKSSVPGVNRNDLHTEFVKLPPLPEQKAIAAILSALDDKIELNLQINRTLEEMAMVLYKEWFVDFGPFQEGEFVETELGRIPKGWEVKSLGSISTIKGGKRLPKGVQLQKESNGHPYIRVRDFKHAFLTKSGLEYVPNHAYSSICNYIVHTNDIILTIVGTIGKTALIGDNLEGANLTENCVKITINNDKFLPELLFTHLNSKSGQNEIKGKTVGSTQPKLPIYNIKSLRLILPKNNENIEEVTNKLQRIYKLVYHNIFENQTLKQTRDTFLPKLISGEVRVKTAEKTIGRVL